MAHFVVNDKVTFDSEKIILINWHCKDQHGLTYAEVNLVDNKIARLYYMADDDYELINTLRDDFGYDPFPRVR